MLIWQSLQTGEVSTSSWQYNFNIWIALEVSSGASKIRRLNNLVITFTGHITNITNVSK